MISAIVYGRNDAYASDLQKRAALGLNSLARVLKEADDEIIFVDYNTPDEFPSFPETIADTLTSTARRKLRVLRVRHSVHRAYSPSPLPVLEAVARNIALRRSNPDNRWVLSTNPDMILLLEEGTLSEVVSTLGDGFYGAPRFEIPPMLWERFRRDDPEGVVRQIADYAAKLHLDEAVTHDLPNVGFDAVGDFQLALREDLFAIHGFDESMTAGWHVDSNLAARLSLLRGPVRAIGCGVRAYHCEHSRSFGARHNPGRREDDFQSHVEAIATAKLPTQAKSWGAPDVSIEEIRIGDPSNMARATASAIGVQRSAPLTAVYGASSFPTSAASPAHVLPYLMDCVAYRSPSTVIGWAGDGPLRELADSALLSAGFSATISASADAPEHIDMFIFDFSGLNLDDDADASPTRKIVDCYAQIVALETCRLEGGVPSRPVIGVNAVHNRFETLMLQTVDCVLSPFTTRIRRGVVRERPAEESWLKDLRVGPDAIRTATGAISPGPESGHVFYGAWRRPPPGAYRACCHLTPSSSPPIAAEGFLVTLEAVLGDETLASISGGMVEITQGAITLDFAAPWRVLPPYRPALEIRLWTTGGVAFQVDDLVVSAIRANR